MQEIVSMCKSEARKEKKQKKSKKKKKEISSQKVARLGSNEIFRGDQNVITNKGRGRGWEERERKRK